MNAPTVDISVERRSEIAAFVASVRAELSDLSREERDELVGGLEADLADQAADGGTILLPDPATYAEELRVAAGLPTARRRHVPRLSRLAKAPLGVGTALDGARRRWFALVERSAASRAVWALMTTLRPAWWVLRAWVAVTGLDQLFGGPEYVTILPSLGTPGVGPAVLVVAVVASVLIGQGHLWPGSGPHRGRIARVVLVALNVVAVALPAVYSWAPSRSPYQPDNYLAGYHAAAHRPGLRDGNQVVRNVYAYNSHGKLIIGVQLFDQSGRPVAVAPRSSMGSGKLRQVTCPWFNGATPLYNVYPLPQRVQKFGTCLTKTGTKTTKVTTHAPPFASVPPVSPVTTPAP